MFLSSPAEVTCSDKIKYVAPALVIKDTAGRNAGEDEPKGGSAISAPRQLNGTFMGGHGKKTPASIFPGRKEVRARDVLSRHQVKT